MSDSWRTGTKRESENAKMQKCENAKMRKWKMEKRRKCENRRDASPRNSCRRRRRRTGQDTAKKRPGRRSGLLSVLVPPLEGGGLGSVCCLHLAEHPAMDPAAQVKKSSPLSNPPLEAADIDYTMAGAPHEFYWTNEKDPHSLRRKAIMKKYPHVSKLTGHEPLTKWISLFVVSLQFLVAYLLRNTYPLSWKFLLAVYFIGAFANQNCFLCIHELSHNLGFKKPLHNRLFSIISNLPIGIPYSASFQPYHQLHHKFLGDEVYDTDIPTYFEAFVLSNVLGKAFFATFQIFFYALRPMFITNIDFTLIHLLNVVVQLFVDYLIVTNWGWNSLIYFIMSSFMAGSLHPTAGHFIAEHYVFETPKEYVPFESKPPPETYSYYGPLNFFTWNVGYHTEHHDFPFIAWSKLPLLRDAAPEFYKDLPQHKSWSWVVVDFIFNYDVSMYSRVKRRTAGLGARKSVNFNDNSK